MHIVISGKHLDLGESLKTHATQSVEKHIKKYFTNAIQAHVTISKHLESFHTNIHVNEGTGMHLTVNADSNDNDAYKSVEKAVKKIEKQLERYKSRIKNHRKTKYNDLPIDAKKYIIHDFDEESENLDEQSPTVVAEKPMAVRVLSVRDAVMHMNLQHLQAMMFINSSTHKLSMVYARQDNNIAWVETVLDMSKQIQATASE